jgi:hypothetical protein
LVSLSVLGFHFITSSPLQHCTPHVFIIPQPPAFHTPLFCYVCIRYSYVAGTYVGDVRIAGGDGVVVV